MGLISIKSSSGGHTGQKYWRTLDQLADTPQFREWMNREFPESVTELEMDGSSRRTVLKLMAASFGLAGLTACSRPVEHIFPISKNVENYAPGEAYFYTTIMSLGGQVAGLLVETHDGRPTKVEGNPDHPFSQGAATALAQASLLNLYDPDRIKAGEGTWPKFEAFVKTLNLGDGSGLRFLSESVTSPSLVALRTDTLKKFPKAKWVEYESFQRNNGREGAMIAFGQPVNIQTNFDKAKVILALDSDFLGLDWTTPLPTKQFSSRRRVETEEDLEKLNRLYSVESQFSITGANADHRLRLQGSEIKQFATDVAVKLGAIPGMPVLNDDRRTKFLNAAVKDLQAAGPEALVITSPRQPPIVHALAFLMNQKLGSLGNVTTLTKASTEDRVESGVQALSNLTGEMNSGQVSTLVILGGNPAYTAPADVPFVAAMSKVANSIHLSPDENETTSAVKWALPEAHFLESWGDGVTPTGVASIQQPVIEPIFGGRASAEVVALIAGSKVTKAHDIVKNYWIAEWPAAERDKTWRKVLNDGVIPSKAPEPIKLTADAKKIAAAVAAEANAASGGVEVGFVPSSAAWDGRYANNGWMQEAPDPMTKLVWGNGALISPATARARDLHDGDVIALQRGNVRMEAAVYVAPGHADNTVTLSLGYGRTHCGSVGKDVGFNANLIRTTGGFWHSPGFEISKTGKTFEHASTVERGLAHFPESHGLAPQFRLGSEMDAEHMNGRPVYRETTIEEYRQNPKVIEAMNELPKLDSVYPERVYDGEYQWGMTIDLGACTGCNACVLACQAENNVPIVGKQQVIRGREMHWLRMDRYYVGDGDEPRAVEQPVPCMQCENAPCENVCPVEATSHSKEGLNDMVYNRCVGTRYCANNCPFKVRHFNFLNWHRYEAQILSMVYNPDVTVRMRGVMEKCTYCVQRIQETRIKANMEGRRPIGKDEIQTACQQTCPANAIVFGNLNDPQSKVSKLKKQERNYAMLAEMDLKPRTTYLARLRNPNPELGI